MTPPSRDEDRSSAALVALRGVGYRYGEDVALEGVDLDVAAGERLVLLGPNGGGKTTLLRLLLGLRAPTAGDARRLRPGLRLGYVPQFPAFDRNFPVRVEEMVLEGRLGSRRLGRGYSGEDRRVVDRLVDRLDLAELRGAYLTELSGGELKRALVARALAREPELLALDEPTASLDEASRGVFWELLRELPERAAIVLATHDLAPATFVPKRALRVDRTISEIAVAGLHGGTILCGHGND
jgi:zinc transport system ATP-binding protein